MIAVDRHRGRRSAGEPENKKLPVLKVLGSMYVYGDMTLALKEIKVVEDVLKAQSLSTQKQAAVRAA
jgi:hypothetical protein